MRIDERGRRQVDRDIDGIGAPGLGIARQPDHQVSDDAPVDNRAEALLGRGLDHGGGRLRAPVIRTGAQQNFVAPDAMPFKQRLELLGVEKNRLRAQRRIVAIQLRIYRRRAIRGIRRGLRGRHRDRHRCRIRRRLGGEQFEGGGQLRIQRQIPIQPGSRCRFQLRFAHIRQRTQAQACRRQAIAQPFDEIVHRLLQRQVRGHGRLAIDYEHHHTKYRPVARSAQRHRDAPISHIMFVARLARPRRRRLPGPFAPPRARPGPCTLSLSQSTSPYSSCSDRLHTRAGRTATRMLRARASSSADRASGTSSGGSPLIAPPGSSGAPWRHTRRSPPVPAPARRRRPPPRRPAASTPAPDS